MPGPISEAILIPVSERCVPFAIPPILIISLVSELSENKNSWKAGINGAPFPPFLISQFLKSE